MVVLSKDAASVEALLCHKNIPSVKVGSIINAKILAIGKNAVILSTNLKSESIVPIWQFLKPDGELDISVGDHVAVMLESLDNGYGDIYLSREKARKQVLWSELTDHMAQQRTIPVKVLSRIRGGFAVDLGLVKGFLPSSLVDTRPIPDPDSLVGTVIRVKIVKMDLVNNNVLVSRKIALEEERAPERTLLLQKFSVGDVLTGTVKSITKYSAFVDIGGIDAFLFMTDLSWFRINHPSEIVQLGDVIQVQVLSIDLEQNRISVGLKQLQGNPWCHFEQEYPVGKHLIGRVVNIMDYGCFIRIKPGIEGFVHSSDFSWTNKTVRPKKSIKLDDEIAVVVLSIDVERRRINLGMKQACDNPWFAFAEQYKKNDIVEGIISSITDFGLFVRLSGNIDGLVHVNDLDREDRSPQDILKKYKKNDQVRVLILVIDPIRERIGLSIRQLTPDAFQQYIDTHKRGQVVDGTIISIGEKSARVQLAEGVLGAIKVSDLINYSCDQPNTQHNVQCKITSFDRKARLVMLTTLTSGVTEAQEG
jgi:small subunit ribosomal protein S1